MTEYTFELFNEHELIEPVTSETISQAYDALANGDCHVLILESRPSLHSSSFIQVAREKAGYTIEIQFERESSQQQLRYETTDILLCEQLFLDYFHGQLPETAGWQDVSAEIAYYYDAEDVGAARKTSHPFFTAHFTADLYYDITDDYAPFGNDTGNDSLHMVEELLQADQLADFNKLPQQLAAQWEIAYYDPQETWDKPALISQDEMAVFESSQITVATGFGVIKITGGINWPLKQRTLLALGQLAELLPEGATIYQQQKQDLEQFPAYDE